MKDQKEPKEILETEILSSLLNNKDYFSKVIHHLQKDHFNEIGNSLIFDKIKNFYIEYNKIPNIKELILSFKESPQKDKEIIKPVIPEIYKPSSINPEMLLSLTEDFIKMSIYMKSVILGAEGIGEHNKNKITDSFNLAEESIKISLDSDFGIFVEEIDKRFDDYQEKEGLKLNVQSFDEIIGSGYTPKTLHLIAAASGVGKSAMLCTFAVQFLLQKQDVVIISLEMAESEFYKRIDSNLLDIRIKDLPNVDKQVLKNNYNKIKDQIGNLVVKEYPAGGLTPLGLQSYLEKLKNEKNINNPVVMVDYLGLMSSDKMTIKDNMYGYFKSIAEELRAVAQKMGIILFSPTQLNRSATSNLEADQSAISDSMGTYMTADSVFIISQTPDYKDQGKMRISFVKNRMSGQTRYFEIGYNYEHFRIDDRYRHDTGKSGDVTQELTNLGIDQDLKSVMNF